MCIQLKGPMPFSFLPLCMAETRALIRKTQSHIITLDETKEDNPVVRSGYFRTELNYSPFLAYHGAWTFSSGNAVHFSLRKKKKKKMPSNDERIR